MNNHDKDFIAIRKKTIPKNALLSNFMPDGWEFYTYDGTIPGRHSVQLKRIDNHIDEWKKLPIYEREEIPVYITCTSCKFRDAVVNAAKKAKSSYKF